MAADNKCRQIRGIFGQNSEKGMGIGVFKVNSTPVINKLSIIIFYQMRVRSGKEEGISSYKLLEPPPSWRLVVLPVR